MATAVKATAKGTSTAKVTAATTLQGTTAVLTGMTPRIMVKEGMKVTEGMVATKAMVIDETECAC
eukprot:CAMPEP_0194497298 /NCGR_PEP_ID=MMETSP0253-20130528/14284_1 /TAXON_ID=2966 /ORGANISM="Noctiluca scintillans" /LENGTH=64 /DNA_ID=CAMNT_0039338787 /DNA_START=14 /DNA_END=208 /DNA_ORIENTATION=-